MRSIETARRYLADELGLEPGHDLQQLERQILQQDRLLDVPEAKIPHGDLRPRTTHIAAAIDGAELNPSARRIAEPTRTDGRSVVKNYDRSEVNNDRTLVGRTKEIELLNELVSHRRGGAILIVGEPGAGKTALAEYLTDLAASHGGEVTWTRCQQGAAISFAVMRSILAGAVGSVPEDQRELVAELLHDMAAGLSRHEGTASTTTTDSIPIDLQRVMSSLQQLIGGLQESEGQRTIYVRIVDDLQWCDAPSLLALSTAVIPTLLNASVRILFVFTLRSTELQSTPALVEALDRMARAGIRRIDLEALTAADVHELLGDLKRSDTRIGDPANGSLSKELAERIHDRTGGNAFYTTELLRLLSSEKSLDAHDLQRGVPPSVGEVVRRRVARLPASTQQLVSMAAVAGTTFDLSIVSEVLGIDLDAALDNVEPALISGLVVDDATTVGSMRFAHAITADAIVETIPILRRASWHGRLATALFKRYGYQRRHLADVTRHSVAAVPSGKWVEAVRALEASAIDSGLGRFIADANLSLDRAAQILANAPKDPERTLCETEVDFCRAQLLGWGGRSTDPAVKRLLDRVTQVSRENGFDELVWASLWLRSIHASAIDDLRSARTYRDELAKAVEARARACASPVLLRRHGPIKFICLRMNLGVSVRLKLLVK